MGYWKKLKIIHASSHVKGCFSLSALVDTMGSDCDWVDSRQMNEANKGEEFKKPWSRSCCNGAIL